MQVTVRTGEGAAGRDEKVRVPKTHKGSDQDSKGPSKPKNTSIGPGGVGRLETGPDNLTT